MGIPVPSTRERLAAGTQKRNRSRARQCGRRGETSGVKPAWYGRGLAEALAGRSGAEATTKRDAEAVLVLVGETVEVTVDFNACPVSQT
jgi:hypothetical protein